MRLSGIISNYDYKYKVYNIKFYKYTTPCTYIHSCTHTHTRTLGRHTGNNPVLLFLTPSCQPDDQEWLPAGDNLSPGPSADHQCQPLHIPHMDEYEYDKRTKTVTQSSLTITIYGRQPYWLHHKFEKTILLWGARMRVRGNCLLRRCNRGYIGTQNNYQRNY